MKKNSFFKNVSMFFVVILILDAMFFGSIPLRIKSIDDMIEDRSDNRCNMQKSVENLAREQMRLELRAVQISWNNLTSEATKKGQTLFVEKDGLMLLDNEKRGADNVSLYFDKLSMVKKKNKDESYFDVYLIGGHDPIAVRVRPQWNMELINNTLNATIKPMKAFGENGYPIVYDSYTLKVIFEESGNYESSDLTTKDDGERYMDLLYLSSKCKNPDAVKKLSENYFSSKRSSRISSNAYSLFDEPNIKFGEEDNFKKYPFGSYNRTIVEKTILPYESYSFAGEEKMQLTVVLRASEKDIMKSFGSADEIDKGMCIDNEIEKSLNYISFIVMMCIILSMATIVATLYIMQKYEKY